MLYATNKKTLNIYIKLNNLFSTYFHPCVIYQFRYFSSQFSSMPMLFPYEKESSWNKQVKPASALQMQTRAFLIHRNSLETNYGFPVNRSKDERMRNWCFLKMSLYIFYSRNRIQFSIRRDLQRICNERDTESQALNFFFYLPKFQSLSNT